MIADSIAHLMRMLVMSWFTNIQQNLWFKVYLMVEWRRALHMDRSSYLFRYHVLTFTFRLDLVRPTPWEGSLVGKRKTVIMVSMPSQLWMCSN